MYSILINTLILTILMLYRYIYSILTSVEESMVSKELGLFSRELERTVGVVIM